MLQIPHGDLLESRRGGVDVLQTIVASLSALQQSGAVLIRNESSHPQHIGWLLFRLGHPVMAFHTGEVEQHGLEALLAIEEDAMGVENQVQLFEISVHVLRKLMVEFPQSVLHLEHEEQRDERKSWWSSVKLPATTWRRAQRLEDVEQLAMATDSRKRALPSTPSTNSALVLMPGQVLLIDSPDPHPALHLGAELAERGIPLFGLFALPHADTAMTQRLPAPHCYALLSPHGGYEVLTGREEIEEKLSAFQWGHDRSVILLNGLDRLGNAIGDVAMLDLYRSICDAIRYNDHVLVCTTDLELFEGKIRHALIKESQLLRTSTLDSWVVDPECLWDHPFLQAPDEDEEAWIEAQLQRQSEGLNDSTNLQFNVIEGGGIPADDEARIHVTKALSEEMLSWKEQHVSADIVGQTDGVTTQIGATSWRPQLQEDTVQLGKFVSESIPLEARAQPVELPVENVKSRRGMPSFSPSKASVGEPRRAQRLPRRKKSPSLPPISPGSGHASQTALGTTSPNLPDWPVEHQKKQGTLPANLEEYVQRQNQALQEEETKRSLRRHQDLHDHVTASAGKELLDLPPPKVQKTVDLPLPSESQGLTGSSVPLLSGKHRLSRESSSMPQTTNNLNELYQIWTTFEEKSTGDRFTLQNEKGEPLKRFKGGLR